MKRTLFTTIAVMILATILIGCADYRQVPPGHVAKRQTASGMEPRIYQPGAVETWSWRSNAVKLVCLEIAQHEAEVQDQILCQDKMNLPFTVEARFAIPAADTEAQDTAFAELSPDQQTDDSRVVVISSERWYNTYAKTPLLATAKGVLSQYETMEVGMTQQVYPLDAEGNPDYSQDPKEVGVARETLNAALKQQLDTALKGTPVKCFFAAFTNFDYPKVVTDAIESAKRVEIEIQQEEAEQRKRMIEKQNEEALAQYEYRIEILDALKVADANRIIGDSVTLGYLWYQQTRVLGEAAKGPNNWGFIPYTAFESQAASGMINAKLMEERLAERLNPEGIEGVSDMAKKMMDERPQVNLEDMANAKPPTSQQPARKRAPQPAPQQPAPQQ